MRSVRIIDRIAYPLVILNIAIENHHFPMGKFTVPMVMFHYQHHFPMEKSLFSMENGPFLGGFSHQTPRFSWGIFLPRLQVPRHGAPINLSGDSRHFEHIYIQKSQSKTPGHSSSLL